MLADKLPITGPCPIDLDAIGFDRTAKVSHCTHCVKNVTVLSNMTKGEAREFLREHKGQTLCVSYARDEDGRIRFRPEPEPELVPVTRLAPRRPVARAAGFAAAFGVAAALAACAPHGEPPRDTTVVAKSDRNVEGGMRVPDPKVLDERKPIVEPQDVMVDGEMAVPDPELVDEPCDKTKTETKPERKPIVERKKHRPEPVTVPAAGGMMIPHDVLDDMDVDGR